jgi:maltose alpha-D-glucosyltransferase/alpha-amylase
MSGSLWYKNAVFYEVYIRAYSDSDGDGHGDIRGLIDKLDYLQELGVDCIWLLPIYPSPLADDGYDIADYFGILPEYGTLADFQEFLDAAHERDMRVITDLVLNHTSDQHPWFQESRKSKNSAFRDYYVWSDTDQKYSDARIIFIDTEESNWTWDEKAGQYFWHRFYSTQPDLNFDSSQVQEKILDVARFWLDMGIDGFRADAVPYLFEREGTICENLPETHIYLKKLRQFIDQHYPGRILLCEANQWPEDVRPYFGDGDEFQMGFHFPVMPRIYKALREADRTSLVWILARTPPIPDECQWCTFLRNHDELTLEMVTEQERQWMWQEYAPEPRMRLNLGIRRRLAPLLDNDRRKIELANSLLFSLPGSPIIYYGDEIGMGDNIWLPDRNGVRTPMQWTAGKNAGFSQADASSLYAPVVEDEPFSPDKINVASQQKDRDSLWHTIRRMVAVRKSYPAFGWGDFAWVEDAPAEVAAYWRKDQQETLLFFNNLSDQVQEFNIKLTKLPSSPQVRWLDLLSGQPARENEVVNNIEMETHLGPYEYRWLKLDQT